MASAPLSDTTEILAKANVSNEELMTAMLTRIWIDVREATSIQEDWVRNRLYLSSLVQFYEITGRDTAIQRDFLNFGINRADLKQTRDNFCHAGNYIEGAVLNNFVAVFTSSQVSTYLLEKFSKYNLDLYKKWSLTGSYSISINNIS